jgi:hypothetical protein
MGNPIITITGGTPDNYSAHANRGGNLLFKSGDGQVYYIDFGNKEAGLSGKTTFPLQVPARGTAVLNVDKAPSGSSWQFRILDAKMNQLCPQADAGPGEEPPVLIVD